MTNPSVIINIPRRIAVGVQTDFDVTFTAGSYAGTMVTGAAMFPAGDYTAWYYETSSSTWMEFNPTQDPDMEFGPSSGFALADATAYFRVRFNTPMVGTFKVNMKRVSDGSTLASDSVTVNAVVGETIDELNARIAAADGGVVKLDTDVTGTVQISNDVTFDGDGHTLHGNIVFDATSGTTPYTVVVENMVMREDSGATTASGYGLFGQNQTADSPVRPLNLSVRNCTIRSYEKKGVYLTNAKTLNMNGCTIGDVATEPMNDPNTYGDYAVDLNLCGVQGCAVRIVGNTFTGSCGAIGAVKVTQRGGIVDGVSLTDDVNTDIKNPVSATVATCIVAGNDFSAMNASRSDGVANVVLGSSPNSDGTARTFNNSYPAEIGAKGETFVNIRGTSAADMTFTMADGSTIGTGSVRNSSGKYDMTIDASSGVTLTGTLRDGASFSSVLAWDTPEGGPVGIGMLGLGRYVLRMKEVEYTSGGLIIPESYAPIAVIANVQGGADAYFDEDACRVLLYRNGAEIAAGTKLTDLTVTMFGHRA